MTGKVNLFDQMITLLLHIPAGFWNHLCPPFRTPDHPSRQPVTGKATFQARRGGAERPETGEAKGWRLEMGEVPSWQKTSV